jgi:DNA-binding NarL/FixJ family response regulator
VKAILFSLAFGISVLAFAGERTKSEVELQAEPIGISYKRLAAAAQRGQPEAVRVILALDFDGGGGEYFQDYWRPDILRHLPDATLVDALSYFSTRRQQEIIRAMTRGLSDTELQQFRHNFPKTTSLTR